MAHHEEGPFDLAQRYRDWIAAGRPCDDSYRIPVGDYDLHVADVAVKEVRVIMGASYRDGAMITSPVLEYYDAKGNKLGSINDGWPFP